MLSHFFYLLFEKYEEILQVKTLSQTNIDICEAYYQAAGEKRKEEYIVEDLKQKITMGRILLDHHH